MLQSLGSQRIRHDFDRLFSGKESACQCRRCGSISGFWFLHQLLFSCPVVPNSLQPHGPQHARLPCPSLSPRVCSNSCPLNQRCCQSISSSVTPFTSCPQSFSATRYFPMSRCFASGGQSIAASASVLPVSIQSIQYSFPLGLAGLFSLQSEGF